MNRMLYPWGKYKKTYHVMKNSAVNPIVGTVSANIFVFDNATP
jgi:hypothetical protein